MDYVSDREDALARLAAAHEQQVMAVTRKELEDHIAQLIPKMIAALYFADDQGSIDGWVQNFLHERFGAEFPNGV